MANVVHLQTPHHWASWACCGMVVRMSNLFQLLTPKLLSLAELQPMCQAKICFNKLQKTTQCNNKPHKPMGRRFENFQISFLTSYKCDSNQSCYSCD